MLVAVTTALRDLTHLHGAAKYQFSRRLNSLFCQQIHKTCSGLLFDQGAEVIRTHMNTATDTHQ